MESIESMLANKNSPSEGFREIFEPVRRSIPLSQPTNDLERVSFRFVESMLSYTSILEALTQSLERYFGAQDAGEEEYMILQADAVIKYSDKTIEHLTEIIQILPDFRQKLGSIEIGQKKLVDMEPKDILNTQQKIAADGFPKKFEQQLREVGLSDADLQGLRSRVLSIDSEKGFKELDSNLERLQAIFQETIESYKKLSISFLKAKRKTLARSLPEPIPPKAPKCVVCNNSLTWIEQYKRWYCYNCRQYR